MDIGTGSQYGTPAAAARMTAHTLQVPLRVPHTPSRPPHSSFPEIDNPSLPSPIICWTCW